MNAFDTLLSDLSARGATFTDDERTILHAAFAASFRGRSLGVSPETLSRIRKNRSRRKVAKRAGPERL
jgi:hypothetical protein